MNLDAEMGQLLARMSVISEASAAKYDSERVHGGEPSRAPAGPSEGLYQEFTRRYLKAWSETAKRETIEDAQKALTHARYAPRRPVRGTDEWRIAIGTDQRAAKDVAEIYGCTVQYVYAMRKRGR